MTPKVKRSEWKAPPYQAPRVCWVHSLDHPGYSGPERAWMPTSFSASQKHPQSSPDLRDAVPPFPLCLVWPPHSRLLRAPLLITLALNKWVCQGFSSNSMFFCQYFISRRCLILTDQNTISELKSSKLTWHQASLNFKSAHPTAGSNLKPPEESSQTGSLVGNGLVLFPWRTWWSQPWG